MARRTIERVYGLAVVLGAVACGGSRGAPSSDERAALPHEVRRTEVPREVAAPVDAEAFDAGAVDAPPVVGRRAIAIGVGEHLSCALADDGAVLCWGSLGLATTPWSAVPVAIGVSDAAALAVGTRHACAARRDGRVWCWGDNRGGQLGDGTTAARGAPVEVAGVRGVVEVAAGGHHSCARDREGRVWCWGHPGAAGHAGRGAAVGPGQVRGLARATRLVAGDDLTCAFVDGGRPRCWGFNTTGLLGAALGPVTRAVESPSLVRATDLALGFRTACLTQGDGLVQCAGDDQFGQLGDHAVPDDAQCDHRDRRGVVCRWTDPAPPVRPCPRCPPRPANLPPPPPPARHEQVFAARSGFVWVRDVRVAPTTTPGGRGLAAGYGRSCAITADDEVACWGEWYGAQDWAHRRPRVIPGTRGAVAVAVYEEHGCALLADGAVACWGYNRSGELGNGTTVEHMIASPAAGRVALP